MDLESDRRLEFYLNDHLAGSAAAIKLASRGRDRDPEAELGRVLGDLVEEIEEDRGVLESLMTTVGATPNPVKQAGALGAELLTRLRHRLPVVGAGSEAVARLEEVEILSLGIEGKRLLWHALGSLASTDARLKDFDFAALKKRAQSQRDRLERFRLELAADAFHA